MTPGFVERHRALELAGEVDAAVEPLWAAGRVTVVLRLLLEDGRRLQGSAQASLAGAELDELCRLGTLLGAPELEREFTPAHRDLLGRLVLSRRRALAQLRDDATRRRRLRAIMLLASATVLGVAAFLLLRNVPTARASAIYSSDFPARQALDGLSTTDWLLPQQQTGWLELTFARPRTVRALVLRNAVNGHYRDRATRAFKVEAFFQTRAVASVTGEFPPIEAGPGPLTVKLDASSVTHVRISVESFYGSGGGLAEVAVE